MPPETYRAELVCLTETEEAAAESGTSFMSDFAREVAAGGGIILFCILYIFIF